jgi:glutaconate CoA-transferase subunit B
VFKFNKTTHKITLDSLHPNVLLEQVKANTGFTFQIPDEVPQTQIPTKKERELIRIIIDPQKVRKIFLSEPKREE